MAITEGFCADLYCDCGDCQSGEIYPPAQAVDRGNSNGMPGLTAVAMTQTAFSYGYAFGE